MSAPRERLWHRPVVALFAAIVWVFAWLPAWLAYGIADLLAVPWYLWWRFQDPRGKRSKGYWRNRRLAFRPGAPLGEQVPPRHLWRWSRHMAWLVVDTCRMQRLHRGNLERHCDLSVYPPVRAQFDRGRGLIFATGHIGTWEVAGYVAGLLGLPITSVFRPSPIPALDRLITRMRSGSGQVIVARQNVLRTLKRTLEQKQVIGLLCDGGARTSAVYAPFLGAMASTVATPALLHLLTGAPIVVVTVQRTGRMRWRAAIWDVIEVTPSADRDADLRAITTRVNAGLQAGIAAAPEQWFWQSRRFRHRPPGETPGPDGLPPLVDGRP